MRSPTIQEASNSAAYLSGLLLGASLARINNCSGIQAGGAIAASAMYISCADRLYTYFVTTKFTFLEHQADESTIQAVGR